MLHLCAFCSEPLSKTQRPASLAGRVEACPRCGAAYTVAPDEATGRAGLAEYLGAAPDQIESISLSLGDGRFLCLGWNPDEMLSALAIAKIVRKSKQSVQTHLQEGRFEGAVKGVTPGGARAWPGWAVPRRSVRAYMLAGRKPYALSDEGKARKGRPPKKNQD